MQCFHSEYFLFAIEWRAIGKFLLLSVAFWYDDDHLGQLASSQCNKINNSHESSEGDSTVYS